MFISQLTNEMKAILDLDNYFNNNSNNYDICSNVYQDFNCFFKDKNILRKYSSSYLICDWVNYIKNDDVNCAKSDICKLLNLVYDAKKINDKEVFQAFADFQNSTSEISNKYWSYVTLERDKSLLEYYDFIVDCFDIINSLTETTIKPFLALFVVINRIRRGKQACYSDVLSNLKFGNLVNELGAIPTISSLVLDVGFGISVSQWRNIACHKNYSFENRQITCTYGKNLSNSVVLKNKEEVLFIAKNISKLSRVLNYSVKFFTYDNVKDISSLYIHQNQQDNRDETWLLVFVTQLLSQGLEIKDLKISKDKMNIVVKDLTTLDSKKRGIYASQFIYQLWAYSKVDNMDVYLSYHTKNDHPYLSAKANTKICEERSMGNMSIEDFFNSIEMELL